MRTSRVNGPGYFVASRRLWCEDQLMLKLKLLRIFVCGAVLCSLGVAQPHKIGDPYSSPKSKWIKVNTHIHTTVTGSSMTPCQAATAYAAAGYGAIILSDKTDRLGTGPVTADPGAACDTVGTNRVNVIPGYEDTQGNHFTVANVALIDLSASIAGRQQAVNYAISNPATRRGAVFLAYAHPIYIPWTAAQIESMTGVDAFEIWNGQGFDSTTLYDSVLASGKRLWLHAADDSYGVGGVNTGWDVVNADSNGTADVIDALKNGRFYATRNGQALRCAADKQSVSCSVYNSESDMSPWFAVFHWIGPDGKVLRQTSNVSTDRYTVVGNEGYVRLVATNSYGYYQVWSQPFYIAH